MAIAPVVLDELTPKLQASIDALVGELTDGSARWAAADLSAHSALVAATHESIRQHAAEWAKTAVQAKGTPAGPLEGEEWMSGPYAALSGFGAAARVLVAIGAGGSPLDGVHVHTAPTGGVAVKVLPEEAKQWVLFHGFSAEVWMDPSLSEEQVRASAGLGARRVGENGGVGLVLGAGNISAIGPLDVLYELVAFNRVSVLKLNPTFASLLPVLEKAFAPLIEFGALRVVNGGAAVGGYLAQHPNIGHVHITGSGLTHDAIVWGTGPDADLRRRENQPLLTKPISSELGGVSPIIVVPGKWSKADLRYQAEHVATQRLHNSGHNCIAGQVLILSSDWPQREPFLAVLREVLDSLPKRATWYPGSERKIATAEQAYPAAGHHGGRVLIEVTADSSPQAFDTEYFAPVLAHTTLPGTGAQFLDAAVAFANDRLDGTLGASLIVAPRDRRAMGKAFDDAIVRLHYGTIGINVWSAIGFLVPTLPWGAYPGNTLDVVGSGIGIVHNALLLDGTERAVVTGPFRPSPRSLFQGEFALSPKPAWFVTAKNADSTSRTLTTYAGKPGWGRIPAILAAALRG